METNLIQVFIDNLVQISPIGFIFGGIAWGYVKAIDAKHKAHIETIEKHVDEIREDKGRYYQLVVEQGATMSEIATVVKRQTDTIEEQSSTIKQVVENQQDQAIKLEKIESKIEWIDRHLS